MDQAEKIGLGTALGGHAILIALLVFGLFQAVRPPAGSDGGGSGDGIAVSIVSESSAPASVTPAPVETQEVPEIQERPEILPDAVVEPAPAPKPAEKAVPKPAPVAKPVPVLKTGKTGTGNGTGSPDFNRSMEKTLGNLGGGAGNARTRGPGEGPGQGASTKTAGQIRSEVNAILGPKIMRYIRQCAPSGPEVNMLITSVTLNLNPNGSLESLSGVSQRGVTDGNKAQASPMERCVTSAIRKAAPFSELNAKDYDGWKVHRMSFQPN